CSLLILHRHTTSTLAPYTTLFRSVGAPMPQVLPRLAIEDDHAAVAVAVRDEHLVGLRVHPDARGAAEQRRVVAAARLVVLADGRSEEHTSELQSRENLVCRLLLEK